ncbi:MAG: LytTr DNA-binding domain, partial [Bacteroidota bacterium]
THRSFILNMDHVKSYLKSEGGVLQLKTGKFVPVSRERKQDVQNYFS